MRLIDAKNAEAYLRQSQQIRQDETVAVHELTGGVSNVVLLVSPASQRPDFVLKQARRQLRVADPWFCSVERIWREVEVLQICDQVLAQRPQDASATVDAKTPSILFTDPDNYLFTMTAAPPHDVWKRQLLAGDINPAVAQACGSLLGTLHAGTWLDEDVSRRVGDRQFFEDLRVDPYYRHLARQQADLRPTIDALCRSLNEHPLSLVHGDFSPKNLLVYEGGLLLVDFEVGHFGDPAFDLGFFLSHLILKAIWARSRCELYLQLTQQFWRSYEAQLTHRIPASAMGDLRRRGIRNWAACMLARVDGKSPVEYLDKQQQELVRQIGRRGLLQPPDDWNQVLDEIRVCGPMDE